MNVICFGDSNTFGYDPRSYIGDRYSPETRWVDILAARTGWSVINEGENGREIPNGPITVPRDTDLLIVMLGTNDLFYQCNAAAVAKKMETFLTGIDIPRNNILLIAPPPMVQGQWITDTQIISASVALPAYYQSLAERLQLRFADAGTWNVAIAFDGVHFTEDGHRAFAEGLCNYLNKGE